MTVEDHIITITSPSNHQHPLFQLPWSTSSPWCHYTIVPHLFEGWEWHTSSWFTDRWLNILIVTQIFHSSSYEYSFSIDISGVFLSSSIVTNPGFLTIFSIHIDNCLFLSLKVAAHNLYSLRWKGGSYCALHQVKECKSKRLRGTIREELIVGQYEGWCLTLFPISFSWLWQWHVSLV